MPRLPGILFDHRANEKWKGPFLGRRRLPYGRQQVKAVDISHKTRGSLDDPPTAVWDCDLATIKAPLSQPHIKQLQGKEIKNALPFTLEFDVKYDTPANPAGVVVNKLKGTCMAGQLTIARPRTRQS